MRNPDPMIFYRTDEQHFVLLKKWGSDFTLVRRLFGFFSHNKFWATLFHLSLIPFVVQLPFRAWPVADIWVSPIYAPGAKSYFLSEINNVANPLAYQFSHLLVFLVCAAIAVATIVLIITSITSNEKWSVKNFSTKTFFKKQFGI